jgi:hypothetical protein
MSDEHKHTTCTACGETVREDRVNAAGVCVNCLALGKRSAPPPEEVPQ